MKEQEWPTLKGLKAERYLFIICRLNLEISVKGLLLFWNIIRSLGVSLNLLLQLTGASSSNVSSGF